MTSAEVMDLAAALYNDTQKAVLNYGVQLPYLNMALNELQEIFELNSIPVTDQTSAVIEMPIASSLDIVELGFGTTDPKLPNDLVEIQQLWERLHGDNNWTPMYRKDSIPHYLEGQYVGNFIWWSFKDQKIQLLPSNQANDLKLDYVKSLFTPFTDSSGADTISILNSKSFLAYRTAGLCSEFIGENKTRADSLNDDAELSINRALGISAKGQQAKSVRRRPFRASFRSRIGI